MTPKIKALLNRWVILVSLFLGLSLLLVSIFLLWFLKTPVSVLPAQPLLTVVAIPSKTATITGNENGLNSLALTPTPEIINGISIGSVVQITGTDGAGLRLRIDPGISSSVQFVGDELELFEVKDGPKEVDGYIWWYLESPYDYSRSGWAASAYMTVILEQ